MANVVNAWRGVESEKTLTRGDLDWQKKATCVDAPTNFFFPEGPEETAATDHYVRALCASCPVQAECLEYSISQPERYGRWGGLNEAERAHMGRRRAREAAHQLKPRPKKKPLRRIDATGVRRRVRAASASGHQLKVYARMSGVSESFLSKLRAGSIGAVREDVAKKLVDAYPLVLARTEDTSPTPMGVAAEAGWWGPEVWEGLDIDDPSVTPDLYAAV